MLQLIHSLFYYLVYTELLSGSFSDTDPSCWMWCVRSIISSQYLNICVCLFFVLVGGGWWWQAGPARRCRGRLWWRLQGRHSRCSPLHSRHRQHSTMPEQSSGGPAAQVPTALTQIHTRDECQHTFFVPEVHPGVFTAWEFHRIYSVTWFYPSDVWFKYLITYSTYYVNLYIPMKVYISPAGFVQTGFKPLKTYYLWPTVNLHLIMLMLKHIASRRAKCIHGIMFR